MTTETTETETEVDLFAPPDPNQPETAWCNTAGCFAGWRAFRDGHRTFTTYSDFSLDPTVYIDGAPVAVESYARERLELEVDDAEVLFWPANSMEKLEQVVDSLCKDPNRSDESKALLRETLQDVVEADKVGRWYQGEWVTRVNPDY